MPAVARFPKRMLSLVTSVAVVAAALVVTSAPAAAADVLPTPAPIEQRSATTVTADSLPTVQIDDGVVWSQVVINGKVYAGGSFANARPAGAAPGASLTPRANLLAYDLQTGNLDTSFAPTLNGQVKVVAASPDGKRLYVGGSFTQANGQSRFNLAAYDTTTGALLTTFKPAVGGSYVNAIAATDTTVYVGGLLSAGAGVARKNLMAFDSTTGKLKDWAPVTDLQVDTMVLTPSKSKLIIGGRFSTVNAVSQRGMAALDLTSGAILPWAAPQTIKNGIGTGTTAGKAGIYSLSTDGQSIFGTGWVFADVTTGNLEGAFSVEPESGNIQWIEDCHGDHYSAYSDTTNVYVVGHPHDCVTSGGYPQANPAPGNLRHAIAFTAAAKGTLTRTPTAGAIYKDWSGSPAPAAIDWYPDWVTGSYTGQGQAAWTVTGSGDYVIFGGEFPYVNGGRQQGLARFGRANVAPKAQGPRLSQNNWVPGLVSSVPGTVRVSMPANWDRDDLNLSYTIVRNGDTANPVFTKTMASTFWNLPTTSFTDTGLTAGATYTYRLYATDGDGNSTAGAVSQVTVSSQTLSPYAQSVIASAPSLFWRLGETSGPWAYDWVGTNDGVVASTVGRGATGAINGDSDKAATFNGANTSSIASSSAMTGPTVFSQQAWFKAASTSAGGKIIGFGSAATGSSGSYDRQIYMQSDGKIRFGVYTGATNTIVSPNSYNDGNWHQVVSSLGPNGMVLYLDGQQVATDSTTNTAQSFTGYWRVGGDNLNSWPSRPTNDFFTGTIDDVAVYPTVLTPAKVADLYALGTSGASSAPTASFASNANNLDVAFDAAASAAASGQTITGYAWDFGDGSTGTGSTVSHSYSAAGSYSVALTVTDSRGLTGSVTKSVAVVAPHAAPVADIGATSTGLLVAFSSAASSAADGATISSQAWDFGDGATSTVANPSHTYANPGTYPATLTVTDSQGATSAPASRSVTVTRANPTAVFTSTVAQLTLTVNGSASAGSNGATITAYDWDFGDNSAHGTGVTASHSYGAPGPYTITLTVTDSAGGTGSVSHDVTVVATGSVIATDAFSRAVTTGWGAAETGGPWGTAAGFSVVDGAGKLALTAKGQTRTNLLTSVSAADVDLTMDLALDKIPGGGGAQFNSIVRRTAAGDYHLKLRYPATGIVSVSLAKTVGTTETLIASATVPGAALTAGQSLRVRFQVVGAGQTALKAKIWRPADAEPTAWLLSATQTDPQLQAAGQIGLSGYLTSTTTTVPLTMSIDNIKALIP